MKVKVRFNFKDDGTKIAVLEPLSEEFKKNLEKHRGKDHIQIIARENLGFEVIENLLKMEMINPLHDGDKVLSIQDEIIELRESYHLLKAMRMMAFSDDPEHKRIHDVLNTYLVALKLRDFTKEEG